MSTSSAADVVVDGLKRVYRDHSWLLFRKSGTEPLIRVYSDAPSAERAAVAQICRLVAGMPLAIELAATWTLALSCAEIAAEIEHNLAILETNLRNVPSRHRSMRAVFDQSWARLAEPERAALARLAVFRSGFTRDAAEQVAEAGLPILARLVECSLLQHAVRGRYQLHELVRQYAEQLQWHVHPAQCGEAEQRGQCSGQQGAPADPAEAREQGQRHRDVAGQRQPADED